MTCNVGTWNNENVVFREALHWNGKENELGTIVFKKYIISTGWEYGGGEEEMRMDGATHTRIETTTKTTTCIHTTYDL